MEYKISKFDRYFLKKYLEDDEEDVVYVIHKHWIEFVLPFIKWLIIWIILPIFLMWLYWNTYTILFWIVCMIFIIWMATYDFFDWYLDVLILTNYCIIQMEWNGFFSSFSARIPYDSVEWIWYQNEWVLSSILWYWDLIIEKENWELIFKNTPNPKKVELILLQTKDNIWLIWRKSWIDKDALKSLLSELVSEHIDNNTIHKRGFKNN